MRKNKDKNYLITARNLGIVSLLWAVCTVNPFLIMGAICSWVAASGEKKGFARVAEVLYIIGAVTSSAVTLVIALLGNVVSLFSGLAEIAGGAAFLIGATLLFDLIIGLAAASSHKGCIQLDMQEQKRLQASQSVGLFGSEIYANENESNDPDR